MVEKGAWLAYLYFDEDDHSRCGLEERSHVSHEAKWTAQGAILSPGARVRDLARL